MARDIFDEVAHLARDQRAIFRGDAMPYRNEAERLANGEKAKAAHERALASSLRIGATCADFLAETMHLHGGSAHGLPLPLALHFNDPAKPLSAAECWSMLAHWRGDDTPWPGHGLTKQSALSMDATPQTSQLASAVHNQKPRPPRGAGDAGDDVPGYIVANEAFKMIWTAVSDRFADTDAAPWYVPTEFDIYYADQPADQPVDRVARTKIFERTRLLFQRALLLGELTVFALNGAQMEAVPPAAFVRRDIVYRLWSTGTLGIDPLWPDHLQYWNHAVAYFSRSDFEHWLDGSTVFEAGDLPAMPLPVGNIPERISYRKPDRRDHITLCEAVTFLALGISLDRERLSEAIRWNGLCDGDLDLAQKRFGEACERLLDAGAQEGGIAMTACHMEGRQASGVVRDAVQPMLRSYRMLDICDDALWFGSGLRHSWQAHNAGVTHRSDRNDYLQWVELDRRQFVEQLVPELKRHDYSDPLCICLAKDAVPDPDFDYAAPTETKAWWSETEALAWIVSRSAALVHKIGAIASENIGGGPKAPRIRALSSLLYWTARDMCRCAGRHHAVAAERWEHCTCVREAGRNLLAAIQRGSVRAFANGEQLGVAAFVGIGDATNGLDWLDVQPVPLFSSIEVMAAFPACAEVSDKQIEPGPRTERRGRAKGTGFQKADRPILKKMADAIRADQSLNPTSAAKLFADEAAGVSTFESKVDRLSRAYRAGRKGE